MNGYFINITRRFGKKSVAALAKVGDFQYICSGSTKPPTFYEWYVGPEFQRNRNLAQIQNLTDKIKEILQLKVGHYKFKTFYYCKATNTYYGKFQHKCYKIHWTYQDHLVCRALQNDPIMFTMLDSQVAFLRQYTKF